MDIVEPRCQHFRVCGGCKFQHIAYAEQLINKQEYIESSFESKSTPIIGCEPEWCYRNKMEYSFSQARSGEKFVGLMKKRGRVENLEECFLTSPWFIDSLKKVREWWFSSELTAYYPPKNEGLLRTLMLREGIHSKEKMVVLTISEEELPQEELASFIDLFSTVDALILRKQIIKKKTPTRFETTLLAGKEYIHEILHTEAEQKYRFRIRAPSFFQPNTLQAEVIYQKAIELAQITPNDLVLDLYCGTGSIGIFAAKFAKKVLGIELIEEAVTDAQKNIELNSISNMQVIQGDVGEVLASVEFAPDIVFVDPPRVGLGAKTIQHLLKLAPKKIIYVSCNPQSQAADCKALGYQVVSLHPIDQFPHTPHVENIALLQCNH